MRRKFPWLAVAATILITSFGQPSLLRAGDDKTEPIFFHAPVPLGVEALRIEPSKKTVYVMASVENQTLDGLHIYRQPHLGRVVRVDGSEVKTYPETLDFRVTISSMASDFQGIEPYPVTNHQSLNDLLLGLKFRLKVFRGLKMKEVDPATVRLIGVPAYEPYGERVYRVSFTTPDVPVDARMVLEVFDSSGTRLTRFHLEML